MFKFLTGNVARLAAVVAVAVIPLQCEDMGPNGEIVTASSATLNGEDGRTYYPLTYNSVDAQGEANIVSGSVIVPSAPWTGAGPRPIAAYAPGTQGLADRCAPSRTLGDANGFSELATVDQYLNAGFAVAITDYPGLGIEGEVHEYVVAESASRALLDVAKAAINLPAEIGSPLDGSGIDQSSPVILTGYSQGGQAAGRAAELEATYAPGLNVVGAILGGAAADLEAVGDALEGDPFYGFAAATVVGISAAYDLDLDYLLNAEGLALEQRLLDACLLDLLGAPQGNLTTDFYLQTPGVGPRQVPEFVDALKAQKVGNVAPAVPTYVFHNPEDEVIPFAVGDAVASDWCGLNADVTFVSVDVTPFLNEHLEAQTAATPDAVAWAIDRVNGAPTASTC